MSEGKQEARIRRWEWEGKGNERLDETCNAMAHFRPNHPFDWAEDGILGLAVAAQDGKEKQVSEQIEHGWHCEWCYPSEIPARDPKSCMIANCPKHGKVWAWYGPRERPSNHVSVQRAVTGED